MGKEDFIHILNMQKVRRDSILLFNEKKEEMLAKAIKYILKKESTYSEDLKDTNTLDIFKHTILNAHFKWIIDHNEEFSIDFNDNYKIGTNYLILPAYQDVYIFMIKEIKDLDTRDDVKKNLSEHLNFLIHHV